MPDVSYIRRHCLEQMDLTPYGIWPVRLTPDAAPLWATSRDPALCLTIDEALAKQGLCATMPRAGHISIEPWG